MFHSGEWEGYWQQGRQRGEMRPLVLVFTPDGAIDGRGEDVVGKFTFKGKYNELGEVTMRKKYLGAHSVTYKGRADGAGGIAGKWTIGGYMTGAFAIKPAECEPTAIVSEATAAVKTVKRRKAPYPDMAESAPSGTPTAVTPTEPDRPSPLRRRRSLQPPTP